MDFYQELNGPRSGSITVIGAEGMQVVTVSQKGEPGLDASRTYTKVKSASDLEAGKAYLIVANTGSGLIAGKAFAASSESYYSYIYGDDVEEKDGVIVSSNASNGYTFVAKDGERVVGFVFWGEREEDGQSVGEIFALYVLREYYGTGLGRRLMDAALEQLKDRPVVCLWAVKGNARAIRFYEKCGFCPDGAELFSERHGSAEVRLRRER